MEDFIFKNSINEHSISELFDTIDNVNNSTEENDKIIDDINRKIRCIFCSYLSENERHEDTLRRYKAYLENYCNMIKEQMIIIDNLIEKKVIGDIESPIFNLQREIFNYSIKLHTLNSIDMSKMFSEKELEIYKYIQLYDLLERYNDTSETHNFSETAKNKHNDKADSSPTSSSWKNYYYLMVCLKRQQELNQTYISYLKSKQNNSAELFNKISDFYAADFQGQLSKNVYCRRKREKITQKQLQERSGIDSTMISKIEKLQQPTTLETAVKLLSALNMGIAIYDLEEGRETVRQGKSERYA